MIANVEDDSKDLSTVASTNDREVVVPGCHTTKFAPLNSSAFTHLPSFI